MKIDVEKFENSFYGDRYKNLTVGELKKLIADLPDETPLHFEDEDYEIRTFEMRPYYDKEFCEGEGDAESYALSGNWYVLFNG